MRHSHGKAAPGDKRAHSPQGNRLPNLGEAVGSMSGWMMGRIHSMQDFSLPRNLRSSFLFFSFPIPGGSNLPRYITSQQTNRPFSEGGVIQAPRHPPSPPFPLLHPSSPSFSNIPARHSHPGVGWLVEVSPTVCLPDRPSTTWDLAPTNRYTADAPGSHGPGSPDVLGGSG